MTRKVNFILKTTALVLIVIVLLLYQNVAVARAQIVSEREAQIAEVVAWNEAILSSEEEDGYIDGVYEGSGIGFGGEIIVSVTVADGKIDAIEISDAASEDPAYYNQAVDVIDAVLAQQTTKVDTVSGATFSSQGILDAISDALGKAVE